MNIADISGHRGLRFGLLVLFLVAAFVGIARSVAVAQVDNSRPTPRLPQFPQSPSALSAYCPSFGGATTYEFISNVELEDLGPSTKQLTVQVFIANPTGCTTGQACPEYDNSPEYVNAWVDFDGNQQWSESERVLDAALTGYGNINYLGTMTAVTQFSVPAGVASGPLGMRSNLGWDFDPNDPCAIGWEWGNVVDSYVDFSPPEIIELFVEGENTPGTLPTTGHKVELTAALDIPAQYELMECSWTGDLIAGNGDKDGSCLYDYTPATGPGPDVATYGEKTVKLTITYRHIDSGIQGQVSREFKYKVFFEKGTSGSWGDDDGDSEPNWFEYWKDDGAVPGMAGSDIIYDGAQGANTYGSFHPNDDKVHLGGAAAGTHYPSGLSVPAITGACPGGNFGGSTITGITSAAEVIAHELRHKQIHHNWDSGGIWNGMADSDDPNHPTKHDFPGDDLPDSFETTIGYLNNNVDSCDLATHKSPTYSQYGDNEFEAIRASVGAANDATKDWANPGKQTDPPFTADRTSATSGGSTSGAPSPGARPAYRSAVVVIGGTLTGSYSSSVPDVNGNALYDSLDLSIGVNVDEADLYNVVAWFEDEAGHEIGWAQTQSMLAAGAHTVKVSLDGEIIRFADWDGPYVAKRVELRVGDEEVLLDGADNVHTTGAYDADSFEAPAAYLGTSHSDTGVDSGELAGYEWLRVEVGVIVQDPGTYTIIGELEKDGVIGVATQTATLGVGPATVDLDFDGRAIFHSRQNGPYQLARVRVLDEDGNKLNLVANLHDTAAYPYTDFGHGDPYFTGSVDEQALDGNGDGDFDFLRIVFEVNSTAGGRYQAVARLRDSGGKDIAVIDKSVDLLPGINTVRFDFAGGAIYAHGVDGPYSIAGLSLIDGNGAIQDIWQKAHTTANYDYDDFTAPLVGLTNTYSALAVDLNGNGKYEELHISVGFLAGDPGVINAEARLVDGSGAEIDRTIAGLQVTSAGSGTIALVFDGGAILAHGVNGPYHVRDLILYHTGDPTSAQTATQPLTTQAYSFSQFEAGAGNKIYLPAALRPN